MSGGGKVAASMGVARESTLKLQARKCINAICGNSQCMAATDRPYVGTYL